MAAKVEFPRARCGFQQLAVLSLHVGHRYARRKFASGAISGLLEFLARSDVRVDIVRGDLNGTRYRGASNVSQCHTASRAPTPVQIVCCHSFRLQRWGQRSADSDRGRASNWSEDTLDASEQHSFIIASDWSKEPAT